MAQIGEFSFVLAKAGLGAGAIDRETYQLALSVIALSLVVSPFWLATARRIHGLRHNFQFTGVAATAERLYPGAYALALRVWAALLALAISARDRLRERRSKP